MSKSITAQLPQKRPKVPKDATTGPAPASSPCPSVAGGRALRTGLRRRPQRFARKADRSTTTRVTRPAPTRPPPSPSRRAADTVKISRRPSTLTNVASASTTEPTATGARWSNCTRVATLDCVWLRWPSVARHVASSHNAMRSAGREHRARRPTGSAQRCPRDRPSARAAHSARRVVRDRPQSRWRPRAETGSAGTTITILP